MGVFDDRMTEKQKKYVRLAYEISLAIVLYMALRYSVGAFDEGAKLCNEARQEWGKQFVLDDIPFADFDREIDHLGITPNISETVPIFQNLSRRE